MAISGHKPRAVFERYNIVSGRDLKDAANKPESYLAKQSLKKIWTRRGELGDNSGAIGRSAASAQKSPRVN